MKVKTHMWTAEKAHALIGKIGFALQDRGWYCALAGSVLFKGHSDHDLDLIFYPHNSTDYKLNYLYQALEEVGLIRWKTKEEVHLEWRIKRKSSDEKHVEIWMKGARRVDVIIWPQV